MNPNALPRRIIIGGREVGIAGLDEIIKAVRNLNLSDEEQIKEELLERVKKRNWVPDEAKEKYAEALLSEYHKSAQSGKRTR
jgi:hypothetical protein